MVCHQLCWNKCETCHFVSRSPIQRHHLWPRGRWTLGQLAVEGSVFFVMTGLSFICIHLLLFTFHWYFGMMHLDASIHLLLVKYRDCTVRVGLGWVNLSGGRRRFIVPQVTAMASTKLRARLRGNSAGRLRCRCDHWLPRQRAFDFVLYTYLIYLVIFVRIRWYIYIYIYLANLATTYEWLFEWTATKPRNDHFCLNPSRLPAWLPQAQS